MYWAQPERVFGDDLATVVLRALWTAGRPMTGRQVANVAGASVRGVRNALERLARQGIVTQTTVGASYQNDLNRDHLLFPALDAAFRLVDPWSAFVHRLAHLVDGRTSEPERVSVAVFGSMARREATLDSDVDLLVVVPVVDDSTEDLRSDLTRGVRAWTGQPAGIYLTTPQGLAEAVAADDPIIESFRADAVTLIGPDVHTYLKVTG